MPGGTYTEKTTGDERAGKRHREDGTEPDVTEKGGTERRMTHDEGVPAGFRPADTPSSYGIRKGDYRPFNRSRSRRPSSS